MSRPLYSQPQIQTPKTNDISQKGEPSKGTTIYAEMEFLTKLNNELKTSNSELFESNECNKIAVQQLNAEVIDWKMLYESRLALIEAQRSYIEELKSKIESQSQNKQ